MTRCDWRGKATPIIQYLGWESQSKHTTKRAGIEHSEFVVWLFLYSQNEAFCKSAMASGSKKSA